MVSVLIVDDAERSSNENTRHKTGLALAVITVIIGVLVLLSPCIKCLILRRQGKPWRVAMAEALQSTPSNQRQAPRPFQLQPRQSYWKARLGRLLPHRRRSEGFREDSQTLPWPQAMLPPTWALPPASDAVPLPPPAHVRHGSVSEARDSPDWDPVPAYGDEAGRPPKYQEAVS